MEILHSFDENFQESDDNLRGIDERFNKNVIKINEESMIICRDSIKSRPDEKKR